MSEVSPPLKPSAVIDATLGARARSIAAAADEARGTLARPETDAAAWSELRRQARETSERWRAWRDALRERGAWRPWPKGHEPYNPVASRFWLLWLHPRSLARRGMLALLRALIVVRWLLWLALVVALIVGAYRLLPAAVEWLRGALGGGGP